MAELSEKQKRCNHGWSFPAEDIATGSVHQDCYECGARRQLKSQRGTLAWKAQMMLKYTGKSSVSIGEADKWFDANQTMILERERFSDRWK